MQPAAPADGGVARALHRRPDQPQIVRGGADPLPDRVDGHRSVKAGEDTEREVTADDDLLGVEHLDTWVHERAEDRRRHPGAVLSGDGHQQGALPVRCAHAAALTRSRHASQRRAGPRS